MSFYLLILSSRILQMLSSFVLFQVLISIPNGSGLNDAFISKQSRVDLVDMYSKCGCFKDAHKVFEQVTYQNTVSWNAMLLGYAQHGHGREENYQKGSGGEYFQS